MDVTTPPQIMVDRVDVAEEADCGEDVDFPSDDHLMNLKALAEKLRLETRRPSYLEWKAQLEAERFRESGIRNGTIQAEPAGELVTPKDNVANKPSDGLKGFGNIDEALSWLRRELVRR